MKKVPDSPKMKPVSEPPPDFQLCVCVNVDTQEVCICGYSGKTKRFINLIDLEKGEFKATHWIGYPEQQGTLL